MSRYNYDKGVNDAKSGKVPNPPPEKNDLSDYLFATNRSQEKRAEEIKDYKQGYEHGIHLSKNKDKK
jgi:hypothetical protein